MNLLLIGCGNLGGALLKAWSEHNIASRIIVVQPSLSAQIKYQDNKSIQFVRNIDNIPIDFIADIIVLAMKPQKLEEAVPGLKGNIIISLLAGVSLDRLASYFPISQKIVRIMPNVAMKIGQSVNLSYPNVNVRELDKDSVNKIFDISGKMIWLDKEELIDILTPISGSGPAYFFLLAETLTQSTMKLGIEEEIARSLVQQTFLGSAMMTLDNHNYEGLVSSVASKAGVTEEALKVLRLNDVEIMDKAISAALKRVKELS